MTFQFSLRMTVRTNVIPVGSSMEQLRTQGCLLNSRAKGRSPTGGWQPPARCLFCDPHKLLLRQPPPVSLQLTPTHTAQAERKAEKGRASPHFISPPVPTHTYAQVVTGATQIIYPHRTIAFSRHSVTQTQFLKKLYI